MLRLKTDTADRWLDLPHGVRVAVRPLTTAISEAAFAEALERIRPVKRAAEDAAAAGAPLDPNEANGANAAWLQGLQWQFLCEALARYGITAWEGIGDEAGSPLPVSPAACAAFAAHPEVGRAFFNAYQRSLEAVAAEGNGSALSSAGAGDGERSTATDAAAPNGQAAEVEIASPAPSALES